ncbi:uncharacterized protein LOC114363367 [Ostrinia furnacalis]|uniref:uncharacterized protein LOC114363367 n=1 Tax=Ostrinia furnacalis TaxID=93504 RepID=UPI00104057E0|nr:uncharacterized protein LOC114363367 [Ostrinia furnacalis]
MPLTRSPSNECSGSAPDLSTVSSERNITLRQEQKRKRGDMIEEDMKAFMADMRKMQASAAEELNSKFTKLQSTVDEIKQQNNDIAKSMEFISQKYDELSIRLESCEKERVKQLTYIKTLETRIEQIERNARNSSIEIRNVPKSVSENKEDLLNIVKSIGSSVNMELKNLDIKDTFRYKSKTSTTMPIVVEFATVPTKVSLLNAVKKFRQDTKTNLTTAHAHIDGPKKPIYISDHLTMQSKKVFASARKFATENSYKFCWTNHGYIYLRKEEGSKAVLITSEEDLNKLHSNTM